MPNEDIFDERKRLFSKTVETSLLYTNTLSIDKFFRLIAGP